ncbi:hypothetical protein CWB72_19925 [Pseudoalteromonas phenolica]|uniref:hypothetical protein n=1 Tax=Pseudoalteromonas phenolica TaxID=161398 RepID=UPI00110ACC7D|nr:hypothetical protein [Pseudoalteromonas phenolica]TMN86349.1 hypothetical protein CWB72_19925 [Pseudoalteromonas phenolica]
MANFKTLMKMHIFLGLLSFILFGIPTFGASDSLTEACKFYLPIVTLFFPLLHFSIAYGCKIKSELARVISRITGILMMPLFPIGTVIGFIIFENTKKKFGEKYT